MKKILVVATIPLTIKSFLIPYAEYFRSIGWIVDGMANGISKCDACREAFDHVWDVNWSRKPHDLKNLVDAPRMIRKIVSENGYALVHVHTPVAGFVTRLALRNQKERSHTKVIYTAHGVHFFEGGNPERRSL